MPSKMTGQMLLGQMMHTGLFLIEEAQLHCEGCHYALSYTFVNSILLKILVPIYKLVSLAQCLKITEKVSFNIASEASYVYILSGQTLIKNANFGEILKT